MKKVAFIIVCWNNKALLDQCFESIHKQTYKPIEVYVADNNSNDGSSEYIEKSYPNIKLIKLDRNYGFAKGNNMAIEAALKDQDVAYLALLNTDATIKDDWVEKLVKVAETKIKVATLQSLTLDYFQPGIIDSHHIYLSSNMQSIQALHGEPGDVNQFYTTEVFGVNAAAAIITRDFIEQQPFNKLFDESFYMYLEDVDVALRALIMGWKNYYVAGTVAYHMGSISSNKRSSRFSLYFTARNQLGMLIKNLPSGIFRGYLFNFLKFDYHFRIVLKRDYPKEYYKAYRKGRIVGIFRAPLYIFKRRRLQKQISIDSTFLKALMSNKGML
jgi:GT2 family glycosyltransferase